MNGISEDKNPFPNGARWLRFDCHLHTRADQEFSYSGDDDYYFSNYVDALQDADISIGVITNHNKFNVEEFRALRKTAKKSGIFLLPGVELSVNDGANGIHTLIVFSDEWLKNGQDYISPWIPTMFPGRSHDKYQHENARSDKNILQTVEELDKTGRDYFLIFAHVEDRCGLWQEMSGGKLGDFSTDRYASVRRRTLGFQKVRTRDKREKVKSWLKDWHPAEVEGSDPKAVDKIGEGNPCYLKIGACAFEAVKYALSDHQNRVAAKPEPYKHSHISSVSFEGGVLDGQTIRFSPELDTLIGIRGSGKSAILEAIRYGLDIPFGIKALDTEYKRDLVDHVLGSGGKVIIRAVDQRGQAYEIRRINGEGQPDVYVDGVLQPGISLRETIIHKPLYFGQKDLSATGEGFEKDLVEKLLGEKLIDIRDRIKAQRQKLSEVVARWRKLSNTEEKRKEYENKKQDAAFRLKFFQEHGIEEKLQRQVDFDTDARKCQQVTDFVKSYLAALAEFIDQHEDDLRNLRMYDSRQNKEFFAAFFTLYDQLIAAFDRIKELLAEGNQVLAGLQAKKGEFTARKEELKEEFARIERELSEQLRGSGAEIIRPEEFRGLQKTLEQADQMLDALNKQGAQRETLRKEIEEQIDTLDDLWREEFEAIEAELKKINENQPSLRIEGEFRENKDAFVEFMKDMFRGSGIREATFATVAEQFPDFGALYRATPGEIKEKIDASDKTLQKFIDYFENHLLELLTWQVPNRFAIEYKGKELKHHSLGQRASALILFVLSQGENDLFIIDQPEDDLDNQTIYKDVIKLIREIKPKTQFLFATHNPNFPVLGDAEQIIACAYADDRVWVTSGSIDRPELQRKIVDIMEGGKDAFRRRKERYENWKP
uniref:PHP domain/AAA domain n=1 Tax=Candidatus Kentrum sp. UNK TaxID=2126344 RepID=A0A451AU83_9GAMM|nr:MAG: PHP domain/AAA domain [Candidatus Kentron sp. UNK]VFK69593.1 MAG: PHP domain/AAA domain [Candidatus Kentron sp. UNK]